MNKKKTGILKNIKITYIVKFNSIYSLLVNIIRDACFYGYTALPNCFY